MTAVLAVVLALAAAPAPPARVQVVAKEFEYRLSRQTVRSGPALLQLANFGEDEHDLRLRRRGGTRTYAVAKALPGERGELSLRLRPGRYRLWCSLADHAKRGMTAELRVR
jgi:hypothetical protein